MLPILALLVPVHPQEPGVVATDPIESPSAEMAPVGASDLTDLSLEQLMDLEVTIASRTQQPLQGAPAAVYVITGDELRRSGHTSLQEALRMVPGFQVARFDSSGWAVTARGFSGAVSSQLVVMIDGVDVATPLFAGVEWELWDLDLADIDRIEVIRGPGAALWGANAVNGVVNVITKSARDTQGTRVDLLAGTGEQSATIRQGGKLGENAWYRVWAKGGNHEALVDSTGESIDLEDWQIGHAGFRGDWELGPYDQLTMWGRGWSSSVGETYFVAFPNPPAVVDVIDDTPKNGGLWAIDLQHRELDGSKTRLRASYLHDFQKQVDFQSTIDEFDFDLSYEVHPADEFTVVYGLGYELVLSDLEGDFTLMFDPEQRDDHTFSAFAQGEWRATSELRLIAGARVEHNSFTGVEVQPNVRAAWTPNPEHTVWAAASRAVRTPSLQENGVIYNIPVGGTDYVTIFGSEDFDSEEAIDFELGWRWAVDEDLSFDLALFQADYDQLQTFEDGAPFTASYGQVFPVFYGNLAEATTAGAELAIDWSPLARWRMRAGYTYFYVDSEVDPASTETTFPETDGSSPRHQINLRSYYDLGRAWELDAGLYYVDELPYYDNPAYLRADVRLGYQPSEALRVSIGGQNLCDPQHPEQGGDVVGAGAEVERVFYVGLSWTP